MTTALSAPTARFLAFLTAAIFFFLVLKLSLLAPLFSGLLTYALVIALSRRLSQWVPHSRRARMVAAWIVAATVAAVLVGLGLVIHAQIRGLGLQKMLLEMGKILGSARTWLPHSLATFLPEQSDLLQEAGDWLREHASLIGAAGLGTLKLMGYILAGIVLGAMVGVSDVISEVHLGSVSRQLVGQAVGLREAFWRVAFAQLKISALNTLLTGIYLMLVLPLVTGNQLPFTKTLVLVTFVAGLLPVLGNLISNTVIVIISLSASWGVALGSLIFLVVIHKLEYFTNARIVGGEIRARAWEILLCMLVMERIFGIAGVIAGPVFYAWLKDEWHRWDRGISTVKSG